MPLIWNSSLIVGTAVGPCHLLAAGGRANLCAIMVYGEVSHRHRGGIAIKPSGSFCWKFRLDAKNKLAAARRFSGQLSLARIGKVKKVNDLS